MAYRTSDRNDHRLALEWPSHETMLQIRRERARLMCHVMAMPFAMLTRTVIRVWRAEARIVLNRTARQPVAR